MAHLKTCQPPTHTGPLQHLPPEQEYRVEDAISMLLHPLPALSHLDNSNTYVGMPFIDFTSAFNSVIPLRTDLQTQ